MPTALNMVSLPEYVIEPPDVLLIEAVIRNTKPDEALAEVEKKLKDTKLDATDKKKLEEERKRLQDAPPEYDGTVRDLPYQPIRNNAFQVQPDGFVQLGVYGSIPVSGLTTN